MTRIFLAVIKAIANDNKIKRPREIHFIFGNFRFIAVILIEQRISGNSPSSQAIWPNDKAIFLATLQHFTCQSFRVKYGGKASVGCSACVTPGSPLLRRGMLGMKSAQTYMLDTSKALLRGETVLVGYTGRKMSLYNP